MTIPGERLDSAVAEAVAGSRDALREVVETIRPIVVRYVRARLRDRGAVGLSADDVAQEVCLVAIQALPRYQDQGRPFLAFVYGIASHRLPTPIGRRRETARAHRRGAGTGHAGCWSGADGYSVRNSVADGQVAGRVAGKTARDFDSADRGRVVGRRDRRSSGQHPGAVRVAQHRALPRLKSEIAGRGSTMSDFRSDSRSDEPSVDDVRRSDDFIDALASSRPVAPQDDNEATLAALLGVWRDDTRWPPATDLISESQAVSALNAGLGEKRFRRDPTSNSDDWPTVTRASVP